MASFCGAVGAVGHLLCKKPECIISVNCCGSNVTGQSVYEVGRPLTCWERAKLCGETAMYGLCVTYLCAKSCGDCCTCGLVSRVCCEDPGSCSGRTKVATVACKNCICAVPQMAVQTCTLCQFTNGKVPTRQEMTLELNSYKTTRTE